MSNDTETRHEIVYHMAKAFFACAWADYSEQVGPHYPAGCEIMDAMPGDEDTDPAAVLHAFELCDTIEKKHSLHIAEIFRQAVAISEEDDGGDHPRTTEYFGHYAAMSAMGHGVGMWDALGGRADKFVGTPDIYMEFSFLDLDPKKYPDTRTEEEIYG
jgi:hypothetical protein